MLEVFDESRLTYRLDRMLPALSSEGIAIGKNRLSKFIKELDLQPRRKKRYIPKTTESEHNNPIASNILPLNKEIKALNSVWQGDITYIRNSEGWLYLSVVLDS
tara:strand:+ start:127 stop:438 length:312 start_codon:yes stop_codon:yes gene_type:complete